MNKNNKDKGYQGPFQYTMKDTPEDDDFDLNKRESDGALLNQEEKMISDNITRVFKQKTNELERFLTFQYMDFDYKVNKCIYTRCYEDVFLNRADVRNCVQRCQVGQTKARQFAENLIDNAYDNFNECIDTVQTKKEDIMNKSFECHDTLNSALDDIKEQIYTEFNYYQ